MKVCLFDLLQTPEGVKIAQCVRQLGPGVVVIRSYKVTKTSVV